MNSKTSIYLFLDVRYKKTNGRFPVKLNVYSPELRKQKIYPTAFDLTEPEFASIWQTIKPRKEFQDQRKKMKALEAHANEVAEQLRIFSFEQFEKLLFNKSGSREDVIFHYQEMISKMRENDQYGNADNYRLSLKSLLDFIESKTGKQPSKLLFTTITKDWLERYEHYMLNKLNRSQTTVSMYMRALRAVFNSAIQQGIFSKDIYPFGKKLYQIPAVRNIKKALRKEDLKKLMDAQPGTPEQEKARDFWFFSYACDGMNLKDIALLRWENLQGDALVYYRAKTRSTTKTNQTFKTIYLNEYSAKIIEKYGSPNRNPKGLIFSIISDDQTKYDQHKAIKNFIRYVNQHLKLLAISIGLPTEISSYWARHSFVTVAVQSGIPTQQISEALHGGNLKTTQNYIDSFPEHIKREHSKKTMEFLLNPE